MKLETKVPPPVILLAAGALMWAIARYTPALAVPVPFRIPLAIVFAAAGVAVAVSGVVALRKAQTTVNPLQPSSATALVASGAYRISRNPMYLGLLLVLVGWAIALANVASLAVLPFFVAYLTVFQIRPEERALEARFPAFAEYRKSVRQWI